jgi:hypothetical protein
VVRSEKQNRRAGPTQFLPNLPMLQDRLSSCLLPLTLFRAPPSRNDPDRIFGERGITLGESSPETQFLHQERPPTSSLRSGRSHGSACPQLMGPRHFFLTRLGFPLLEEDFAQGAMR